MILTCPNCASRFILSAQALAPEGRRVRCSTCEEEWFQLADPDELLEEIEQGVGIGDEADIPDAVKPQSEGTKMPVLSQHGDLDPAQKKARLMGYAGALAVLLVIFSGLISVRSSLLHSWPASNGIYALFGMGIDVPGEGLVFDHITAKLQEQELTISGDILNLTPDEVALPPVNIAIRNAAGDTVFSMVESLSAEHVAGEQSQEIKVKHTLDPGQAPEHIQIRFALTNIQEELKHDDSHHDENTDHDAPIIKDVHDKAHHAEGHGRADEKTDIHKDEHHEKDEHGGGNH